MQHLSPLEQEAADCRQHHSLESSPKSTRHELCYQYQNSPDKHLGQEAVVFSSSAPAHMVTQLPPIRTSIPSLQPKQVRRKLPPVLLLPPICVGRPTPALARCLLNTCCKASTL